MMPAGYEVQRSTVRHEFKYVLRPDVARRAVGFIRPFLEQDDYCRRTPSGSYTVRSVYFDSPGLEGFHAKCSGQQFREKYRVRTYGGAGSAPLFFEVKQKRGLDYFKHRIRLERRDLETLRNRNFPGFQHLAADPRARRTLHRIFFHLYRKAYAPVLLVAYDREAYVGLSDATSRVTLDRNLRVTAFPEMDDLERDRPAAYPIAEWVILEVKFTHTVPRWMKSLNTVFQLKPQACSKYCTGVAHCFGANPKARKGQLHF